MVEPQTDATVIVPAIAQGSHREAFPGWPARSGRNNAPWGLARAAWTLSDGAATAYVPPMMETMQRLLGLMGRARRSAKAPARRRSVRPPPGRDRRGGPRLTTDAPGMRCRLSPTADVPPLGPGPRCERVRRKAIRACTSSRERRPSTNSCMTPYTNARGMLLVRPNVSGWAADRWSFATAIRLAGTYPGGVTFRCSGSRPLSHQDRHRNRRLYRGEPPRDRRIGPARFAVNCTGGGGGVRANWLADFEFCTAVVKNSPGTSARPVALCAPDTGTLLPAPSTAY
jgi:hypothetical protein